VPTPEAPPRADRRRLTALLAAVVVAVAAIAVVLGVAAGGGDKPEPLVVPPADTPLSKLLDTLDDSIDRARR
jgi:hypothetical protein